MGVSRSGYYKWRKRDKNTRDLRREEVIALVSEVHKAHPSHGYRWVAAFIRVNYQQDISDNYVYKAFRFLGIKAKTKHQVHYRPRKIRDLYPNLIFTTWDTVDRPRQVIVSDMTVLKPWIFYLELTLYFDVFTKQILTWKLSERRGGREQYLDGLADVVELLRGKKEPTIIHTDQGSVYSSKAYNELIQDCNVVRSMSRAGETAVDKRRQRGRVSQCAGAAHPNGNGFGTVTHINLGIHICYKTDKSQDWRKTL